MAPRIRSIKPILWDSESLGRCSVLARLTFLGMISMADDDGRGRADVRYLLGRIHTYANDVTEGQLQAAVEELRASRCVVLYAAGPAHYYYLPGWRGNQLINRPTPSVLPPPPVGTDNEAPLRSGDDETPPPPPGPEQPVLLFKVAEGPGPKDWALRSAKIVEYRLSFPGIDVEAECRRAWQWCEDNPSGRKPHDQMAAFLSRWMAKAWRESKEAPAATPAKATPKCRRCFHKEPVSDKWPYCADCTFCQADDCDRSYPSHKKFRQKKEMVYCADHAEEVSA